VALLPGSRASEVEALLPTLLESVKRLSAELPVEARIIRAPTIPPEMVDEAVELAGLEVEIVDADRFAAVADSHLALCASGTATLEVGLLGTPMVMVYRLASWTYVLARLLVRLPNVSLVNLVLGRRVVPELIQGEANPKRIASEAARLLTDAGERNRMRAALAEVRGRLGESGASRRAAGEVASMLAELAEGTRN
jgi:lipid-A-disaccharide synthase